MTTNAALRGFLLSLLPAAALMVGACCKNQPTAAPATGESKPLAASEGEAPARPTTKESCDACKGVWAKHGLAETEACICRTKDVGKACRDGDECEGQCLVDEAAGFQVVEKGPPAKGYWKGKCSEFDTTFGCNKMLRHGARKQEPEEAEDAADTICVD